MINILYICEMFAKHDDLAPESRGDVDMVHFFNNFDALSWADSLKAVPATEADFGRIFLLHALLFLLLGLHPLLHDGLNLEAFYLIKNNHKPHLTLWYP